MKKTISQIKNTARQSLLGHYPVLIGAWFVTELILLLINIPFSRMVNQGITYQVYSRSVLGTVGECIIALISLLFSSGLSRIHLQIARKEETAVKELLYPFRNRPDRYLGFGVLLLILSFGCTLPGLLVVMIPTLLSPGSAASLLGIGIGCILLIIGFVILFIVILSWSLTPFLMLDDIDIRVMDAIRKSRALMRGNKGRLFGMYLSFIGWILLSLLTFGVGLLWIVPYISHSQTWFYLELTTVQANATE